MPVCQKCSKSVRKIHRYRAPDESFIYICSDCALALKKWAEEFKCCPECGEFLFLYNLLEGTAFCTRCHKTVKPSNDRSREKWHCDVCDLELQSPSQGYTVPASYMRESKLYREYVHEKSEKEIVKFYPRILQKVGGNMDRLREEAAKIVKNADRYVLEEATASDFLLCKMCAKKYNIEVNETC